MNWKIIAALLLIVYYIVVMVVFVRIMLENRNPLKTQSYLLLLVLLPVIGLVVYLFFGINYRRQKWYSRKSIMERTVIANWLQDYKKRLPDNRALSEEAMQEKYKLPMLFFRNAMSVYTTHNRVRILRNGEEKFPALIAALEKAGNHIHLEYYKFVDDDIGTRIINILCERAKAGIEVRLIVDSIGSSDLSDGARKRLRQSGVELYEYNPVIFTQLANKVNYRDHRKIAIVDGRVGFVGGINVSDYYINHPGTEDYWRDTHCVIEGQAVWYMQILFLLNWFFVSKKVIEPTNQYLPVIDDIPAGVPTMLVESSPDSDSRNLMEAYFSMITNARRELLIATPYFIPNEGIMTALKTAAKSGVKVMLLLPEKTDTRFVHAASLSFVPELLENDVLVYQYHKGMVHSKIIVVDDQISTVGSANMDYRSFDNNAEINAFFFDRGISRLLKAHFMQDIGASKPMDLEMWKNRPRIERLVGSAARLIAPLL